MAIKKGTKMYSIRYFKCPRCHEGDFFVSNPYNLQHIGKVHENCSECGLKYAKEPGFFYGAMYVSYAFGVALFVAVIVLYYIIFRRIDVWILFGIIGFLSVVTAPINYALSKIIWANFFMGYKPNASENFKKLSDSRNETSHSHA